MSLLVKYSTGSTYTLVANKVETGIAQDISSYHVPLTNINGGVRQGLKAVSITISGDIEDKTACLWHDIVAVSLDSGTSYQTVYFASVSFSDDRWSSIYPFSLELLASPLKEQAATRFPTGTAFKWGLASQTLVSQAGNTGAPIELHYLAPLFYFPLAQSIEDFAGRGLTFTRTLAKTHAGVSYAVNIPAFDNGLYIGSDTSQDTPKWTPAASTLKSILCQIKQTRYPSAWLIGAGAGTANLLTANQSNAETDTTGMTSAGGTLTRNTSTPLAGAGDFKLVSTGSNDLILKTATTAVAVTAGQWYTAQALVKCTVAAGRQVKIGISWYTAANALVQTDYGAAVACPSAATVLSATILCPATATKAYIWIDVVSSLNAEILYADSLMLESIPVTLTVWTAAKNKLTIDTTANTVSWTDDTTTVAAVFPTASYMAGTIIDLAVIDDTSHAVTVAAHAAAGAWTHEHGTLAAIEYPELTLGNLDGSIANLIEYPYALAQAEYEAPNYSLLPLLFNTLYIANNRAEEIIKGTDGTLETATGTDISGNLAGADVLITSTAITVTMSQGLAARWYLNVKRTDV